LPHVPLRPEGRGPGGNADGGTLSPVAPGEPLELAADDKTAANSNSAKPGTRNPEPGTGPRVTIERMGNGCGEVFAIVVSGRSLGVVHSELVALTIKSGIEQAGREP